MDKTNNQMIRTEMANNLFTKRGPINKEWWLRVMGIQGSLSEGYG